MDSASPKVSKRILFIIPAVLAVLIGICLMIAWPDINRNARSSQCGNQMLSLNFAAQLWASDHGGKSPPNLLVLSNEVGVPQILICPEDPTHQTMTSWPTEPGKISYEVLAPLTVLADANAPLFRCKVHGHVAYADGTVLVHGKRHSKSPRR